ncbi:hypothetical protein BaRGS_00012922 [Batillaria attramentaria]|uniref:Uncharacterized protein n=1 Tax=Batillaria attramentaria TaxID=370345 RepID=A0ABD0L8Y4_9CAEN
MSFPARNKTQADVTTDIRRLTTHVFCPAPAAVSSVTTWRQMNWETKQQWWPTYQFLKRVDTDRRFHGRRVFRQFDADQRRKQLYFRQLQLPWRMLSRCHIDLHIQLTSNATCVSLHYYCEEFCVLKTSPAVI